MEITSLYGHLSNDCHYLKTKESVWSNFISFAWNIVTYDRHLLNTHVCMTSNKIVVYAVEIEPQILGYNWIPNLNRIRSPMTKILRTEERHTDTGKLITAKCTPGVALEMRFVCACSCIFSRYNKRVANWAIVKYTVVRSQETWQRLRWRTLNDYCYTSDFFWS
jgi:hypothetical protein